MEVVAIEEVKVLVGCPTSDYKGYCAEAYAEAVKSLSYKNYDILLVDNSEQGGYAERMKTLGLPVVSSPFHEAARERIVTARNVLRQKVLDDGYEYFFSLEQDVIPPRDVIERLLRLKERIATGIYFNQQTQEGLSMLVPMVWKRTGQSTIRYIDPDEVMLDKVFEVGACGMGCVLIHRSVLERIRFRYDPAQDSFDDMWFSQDAFEAGIRIMADTSVKCRHLVERRPWDWKDLRR